MRMNALRGTNGKQRAAGGPAQAGDNLSGNIQQAWDNADAQYKQLGESAKRMEAVRREMDALMKLGDTITVEEVIKGAGALVGAGFSPQVLAGMLAQMPTTGGQGLAAWVQQQDQQARQMEARLHQNMEAAAVHRGIAAMTSLHADHIRTQGGGRGGSPGMGNSMMPGGAGPPSPAPDQGQPDNGEE